MFFWRETKQSDIAYSAENKGLGATFTVFDFDLSFKKSVATKPSPFCSSMMPFMFAFQQQLLGYSILGFYHFIT